MDDRRFDSLVKGIATGTSRRSLFKGLLGLGGAAVVGGTVTEQSASAARRPPKPPKPVSCPGQQTWNNGVCVCPAGLSQCGPDCCNDSAPPGTAAYSECCDNACCQGHCYGEELCCDYPRTFCETTQECCPLDMPYCCGDGCCATQCCDTTAGSVCCEGDTPKCCPGDICIPADGCCTDAECSDGDACTLDVCTAEHICTHTFDCTLASNCCDDGDACTANICNENGSCSHPFYCSSDACCDDGDPCTRSTCNSDGTCTPTVRDCRIEGCGCVASDACHPKTCDQDTGACSDGEYDCTLPGCCTPSDMCFQAICDAEANLCRETLYCANDELTNEEADACCSDFGNPDPACLYVSIEACTDVCPSGLGFVQVDTGCCFKVYCDCCSKYDDLGLVDFGDCLGSCEFSPG